MEFCTEENLDVQPYVFQRNITTVVVPLGEKLQEIKDAYLEVNGIFLVIYFHDLELSQKNFLTLN